MAITDVTVFGAGIFGLSIAWLCQSRGAKVVLCDPKGPIGGASGGVVGALAPHVPENWNTKKQFQFESLIMAQDYWDEIESVSGLASGYARGGRVQPLLNPRVVELARERAVNAGKLWQGKAEWTVLNKNPHQGWAPDSPTGYWVRDSLSGRILPRMAGSALARAFKARGGQIVAEAPEKGAVIWATGVAGLAVLSKAFGLEIGHGIKGQSARMGCDARGFPQIFAAGLHIVPHADGTVSIGSTSERQYDEPNTTDELLEQVLVRARALCPALRNAAVLERWAGLRPRTHSRAPMLGAWPGRPGHFIANGGFKIGFGMAPKVAEVMADLVLEKVDNIPFDFKVEASL